MLSNFKIIVSKVIFTSLTILFYSSEFVNASTSSGEVLWLSIDVETSGPSFKRNGILSIGCSVQNKDSEELYNFQVNLSLPDDREFDECCLDTFWKLNPVAYEFVTSNTVSPEHAMLGFASFVARIEEKHSNIAIISDNPSFDIAWINLYLSLHTDRNPLNYSSTGHYRMVWDTASLSKNWLCIKSQVKTLIPPSGHRNRLKLVSRWPHDHTPLNDARRTADFHNQVIKQEQSYLNAMTEVREEPKTSPQIEIVPYNPLWAEYFETEKRAIREALGEMCVDVYHVGSTSVPGLSAKPIIDIIAVVKNTYMISGLLESQGYTYKGEYNIPLRAMYGKKGTKTIFLHVHEAGSAEIESNIVFRDYLRGNALAREEYSHLKTRISYNQDAKEKVGTGITKYNLGKNSFIQKALEESGFKGLCPRLCTQDPEWEVYNSLRHESMQDPKESKSNAKNLVLYEGPNIIAAAQVVLLDSDIGAISFIASKDAEMYSHQMTYFLGFIEKWLIRKNLNLITATSDEGNIEFFQQVNYKAYSESSTSLKLFKILDHKDSM